MLADYLWTLILITNVIEMYVYIMQTYTVRSMLHRMVTKVDHNQEYIWQFIMQHRQKYPLGNSWS